MIILEERPGVGVILRSKEQYDQYMQMCEDSGWVWRGGQRPTEHETWWPSLEQMWVSIRNRFTFSTSRPHSRCTSYIEFEELFPLNFDEVYNSFEKGT